MQPAYILIAIPFFLLSLVLEYLLGKRKNIKLYRLNDTVNNLLVGIGQQVCNLFNKAFLFGLFILIYSNFRVFEIPSTWWSILLCVVLYDFVFYWAHRWGHEVNLFWGAHVVHHQSEEYNLSVALRQSWFHNLLAFFLFLPLPLLGFPPLVFGAAAAIQTIGQFWIHTKLVNRLPKFLEYVLNTPSHHRVHHSSNAQYLDKNYGGIFIVWDRMFGTFKQEEAQFEMTYGITTQLKSWNPIWANIHYYVELWNISKSFSAFKDKFKLLFARPGWLPENVIANNSAMEKGKENFVKYDSDVHTNLRWYAAIQFVVALLGSVAFMYHFDTISTFYKCAFASVIFTSMLIIGGIFEQKKWIWIAEYFRLAVVLLSLNTFYWYWYVDWFGIMLLSSLVAGITCMVWLAVHYILNKEYYKLNFEV
ncbi:MAG TPA: sterol desaturase family protein [Chitinophagales bacterium]|nr:sterol desaturase family protein [Chitinophagales bacterium]